MIIARCAIAGAIQSSKEHASREGLLRRRLLTRFLNCAPEKPHYTSEAAVLSICYGKTREPASAERRDWCVMPMTVQWTAATTRRQNGRRNLRSTAWLIMRYMNL